MKYIEIIFLISVFLVLFRTPESLEINTLIKIILMYILLYLVFNNQESFELCYPVHQMTKPENAIKDPNKAWCKFSGETHPLDNNKLKPYITFPKNMYNITENIPTDINEDLINYYLTTGHNLDIERETIQDDNHPIFPFKEIENEKSFIDRRPKAIVLSKATDTFVELGIESKLLEYGIKDRQITDNSISATKYKISELSIDIMKPTLRKRNNKFATSSDSNMITPFVLFLHGKNSRKEIFYENNIEQIKNLLNKGIACVFVSYQDTKFKSTYFTFKYLIQHFKHYHKHYKFDPNQCGIVSNSLGSAISYIFCYYNDENRKELENLMQLEKTSFQENTRVNILAMINPIMTLDCHKYMKFLQNNTDYCFNSKSKEFLSKKCNLSNLDYFELNKENSIKGRKMLKLINIIDYFNNNKSANPLYVENKRSKKHPLDISDANNQNTLITAPVFAKHLYETAKENNVEVVANIPMYKIKSSRITNFSDFLIEHLTN